MIFGFVPNLLTDSVYISGDNPILAAAAGTGTGGNGGTINIHDISGTLTILTDLNVQGSGTGNGGTIQIGAYDVNVTETATLYAHSGTMDGHGGSVTINAGDSITLTGDIDASASSSGSGYGGTISLTTPLNAVDLSLTTITATGGDGSAAGLGGTVTVTNAGPNFDVNKNITVDGGDTVTTSSFDGAISLNSVQCQQWKTTYDWPTTYWDCTGNNPPSAMDQIPASAATTLTSPKAGLEANTVYVYAFNSGNDYNSFFSSDDADFLAAAGVTKLYESGSVYVTVFQNCTNCAGYSGTIALTSMEYTEASYHELGHAVDFTGAAPGTTGSLTDAYTIYSQRDFINLDYAIVGDSKDDSLPRDPCVDYESPNGDGTYTTITAPFAGVYDSDNHAPFCTDGEIEFVYTGLTNSAILQSAESGIFNTTDDGYYQEIYAQTFAFQWYAAGLMPYQWFVQAADGVFANSYFACTSANAVNVLGGSAPIATECSVAVPGWYTVGD